MYFQSFLVIAVGGIPAFPKTCSKVLFCPLKLTLILANPPLLLATYTHLLYFKFQPFSLQGPLVLLNLQLPALFVKYFFLILNLWPGPQDQGC